MTEPELFDEIKLLVNLWKMINVKNAVKSAYDYFQSIQDLMNNHIEDLNLEEVELSEDEKFWLITLGFDRPIKTPNLFEEKYKRVYKLFKVNSETGAVEAMKIREV